MVISGIISLYNMRIIYKGINKVEAVAGEMHKSHNLQLALDMALMPINDYIITGRKGYMEDFRKASVEVDRWLKELEGELSGLEGVFPAGVKEEREILKDVGASWQKVKEMSLEIFAIPNPVGNSRAAAMMEEMDYKWAYPAIEKLRRWQEIDKEEYREAHEESERALKLAVIVMIAGGVMLFSLGGFLAVFYSRIFVRPIEAIHNGADKIAAGDFKTRLDIRTGDEIEQLSNAMNEMAAQLDSLYSNMQQMVDERTRELQYERNKLNGIFEAMEDGVYLVDQDYNIQYLNPVLLKEFGPVDGKKCYAYFHDRTEVCPWCLNQRVFAGETVRWEWTSLKNGKIYDLLDTPMRQSDGSIWKLEIFRDITEKKRAEEALYKSEEQLKLQISRMPFGYIVWDTGFRVVSWNPAAERIFGFTPEEAKGKHPYDLIVPKEAQPHVDVIWRRLLEGDTAAHSINENLTKDGRTIICEWTNTPLRYHNGDIIGVLSMVQDITERRKAENALQESEERFRTITNTASDAIICLESLGNIKLWNKKAEEMFGYTADEVMGRDMHELIVPEKYREKAREGLKGFFQTGAGPVVGKTVELTALRKDGTEFPIALSISAMEIQGEWLATGIIRDITDRKKAEDKIMEQLDFLKRFEKVAIDREFRIKELRDENDLLKKRIGEMEGR